MQPSENLRYKYGGKSEAAGRDCRGGQEKQSLVEKIGKFNYGLENPDLKVLVNVYQVYWPAGRTEHLGQQTCFGVASSGIKLFLVASGACYMIFCK